MLLAVTAELPPPSGPPQALPVAEPPSPVAAEALSLTPPPYAVPPRTVNGLAVAALCCGLAAFVPLVGVLAVVFGAVALNQLRAGFQRGRKRAVAGIVLGVLGTVAWVAVFVIAVVTGMTDEPQAAPAKPAAGGSQVFVDKLKAGDCFSGGRHDQIDLVTRVACTSPHESQVVTVVELPDEPYPGEAKVTAEAEQSCSDKADPLITDQAYADLDPSYIYPDADSWRGDRTVLCLVEAGSGTTTGSALK